MIDKFKIVIKNYLENKALPKILQGTKVSGGVKVSDELTVPDAFIYIPTWLKAPVVYPTTESAGEYSHSHSFKQHAEIATGDTVYLLRDLGGQLYFVLDVIKNG